MVKIKCIDCGKEIEKKVNRVRCIKCTAIVNKAQAIIAREKLKKKRALESNNA